MSNLRITATRPVALGFDQNLPSDGDAYLLRVIKLVPSESLSLYLIGENIIPSDHKIGMVIFSLVCLLLTFLSRKHLTKDPEDNTPQWKAVIITSISFIIWVYASGGVFKAFDLYESWVAQISLITWVFLIPNFYKGDIAKK